MEKVGSAVPELQKPPPYGAGAALSELTTPRAKLNRSMRMKSYDVANVLKRGKKARAVNPSHAAGGVKPIIVKPSVEAKVFVRAHVESIIGCPTDKPSIIASSQHCPRHEGARLAVAVPKRLLKKSVDRNLVKRWMREALRQHGNRAAGVDLLLTLTAKFTPKERDDRLRIKAEIQQQISLALMAADGSTIPKNTRISR